MNDTVFPLTPTEPETGTPPLVVASFTVDVVNDALVIGSEKVAVTGAMTDTVFVPFTGEVLRTVGGVVSGARVVVKLQVKFAARALPAASFAPVVTVARYCVFPASALVGRSVAVFPETVTEPATFVPPAKGRNVKVVVFSVEFVIASEKVTDAALLSATPVAEFAGEFEMTVGFVVSGAAAVVNRQVKGKTSEFPAASVTAVETLPVYWVLETSAADGVKIAVLPLTDTVPKMAAPPAVGVNVILRVLSVVLFIGSEKFMETEEFVGTLVALPVGEVVVTVGGVVSDTPPVVNVHEKFVPRALPAASVTVEKMVAVYWVDAARLVEGVKTAVLPVTDTPPVTACPPLVGARTKLDDVMEALVIGSEKVAEIDELRVTPVAPCNGNVSDTVGGVRSGAGAGDGDGGTGAAAGVSWGESPPPPPPQLANSPRSNATSKSRKVMARRAA